MSFSKATVDNQRARIIFEDAIAIAKDSNVVLSYPQWEEEIKAIIKGTHLTYRYILVTALLGKATNSNVNSLALQAKAELDGAYDARSLCHKVIVPLEQGLLDRSLGGSNEPFLNKPARFPSISLSNAVRAGKDGQLLWMLHKVLSELETSDQAFGALCIALRYSLERQISLLEGILPIDGSDSNHLEVLDLIEALLAKSVEGQIAAVVTGTVLYLHLQQFEGFDVKVHPPNQSGASSREVSDIDIRYNGRLFATFEVKDKNFSEHDVGHAAFKTKQNGLKVLTFITGPNANLIGSTHYHVTKNIARTGVNVIFIEVVALAKALLALRPSLTVSEFVDVLETQARTARVKDEFFLHAKEVLATEISDEL